jgi:hypothetical protein
MSSPISLDSLTTPMTRAEVEKTIYDVFGAIGTDVTSWKPGAVARTLITAAAILISACMALIALIARSGFLELSSGVWLTLVARYVYGVDRFEATFAAGEVTVNNAGANVYAFDPGELIFLNPDTHKTYRNTALVEVDALETGVVVAVAAVEAGAASTSIAGTITQFETPLPGLSCSNVLAVVGRDEETDGELKLRCHEKPGALSPMGPKDAYGFAARNAKRADGSPIGVTRVRLERDGFGHVYGYYGTATGPITGDASDPLTDLGAIDLAIQRNAAPLCVTAHTASATLKTINVVYEVWMYNTSGLTEAQIALAIQRAIVKFLAERPLGGDVIAPAGGKVFHNALRAAIMSARPEIYQVTISTPSDDTALIFSDAPVLGTAIATAIHQVDPRFV